MLSIVIPVFNEDESIQNLHKEILLIVPNLGEGYEIIFVDDGSTDKSFEILKEIQKKNEKVRLFSFRKNQGKSEALTFGFKKAKGDYIVTLDSDLQDKPSEIPKLMKKLKEGYDLACGWRVERRDSFLKILSSKIFNSLASFLWGLKLHDYNCGQKVYTSGAAKSLRLYGGMYRFIPLLAYKNGFKVCEVPVIHGKRKFGKSKYGFSKLWKDIPDIFTMLFISKYGKRPLHFFGTVGGILLMLGVVILVYLTMLWFQGYSIGRRPLLFLGMLLVISGFQVFFTGFLADLIINLFQQSKNYNGEEETTLLKYSTDT